jgi:hypothetical protein
VLGMRPDIYKKLAPFITPIRANPESTRILARARSA